MQPLCSHPESVSSISSVWEFVASGRGPGPGGTCACRSSRLQPTAFETVTKSSHRMGSQARRLKKSHLLSRAVSFASSFRRGACVCDRDPPPPCATFRQTQSSPNGPAPALGFLGPMMSIGRPLQFLRRDDRALAAFCCAAPRCALVRHSCWWIRLVLS